MPTVVVPSSQIQLLGHAPTWATTSGARTLLRVNPSNIEGDSIINVTCRAGAFTDNPNTKVYIGGVEIDKIATTPTGIVCKLPAGFSLQENSPLIIRDYGWDTSEKPYWAAEAMIDPAWSSGVDHAWLVNKDVKRPTYSSSLVGGAQYINDYALMDGLSTGNSSGQHVRVSGGAWQPNPAGYTILIEWSPVGTDNWNLFDSDRSYSWRGVKFHATNGEYVLDHGAGFTANTNSNFRGHHFSLASQQVANPGLSFTAGEWYKVAIGVDDIGYSTGTPSSRISVNGGAVTGASSYDGSADGYNSANGGDPMIGGQYYYPSGYGYANVRVRMVAVLNHKTATNAELQDLSANPYKIFARDLTVT